MRRSFACGYPCSHSLCCNTDTDSVCTLEINPSSTSTEVLMFISWLDGMDRHLFGLMTIDSIEPGYEHEQKWLCWWSKSHTPPPAWASKTGHARLQGAIFSTPPIIQLLTSDLISHHRKTFYYWVFIYWLNGNVFTSLIRWQVQYVTTTSTVMASYPPLNYHQGRVSLLEASGSFLAQKLVRSPRKLYKFII